MGILRSELRGRCITMPWKSPPLRSNDRRNWRAQHAAKSTAKDVARIVGRDHLRANGPIDYPVTATIIWTVPDRRRRDVGASSPTLKVCLDAFVEIGLLPDDRAEIVTEERCRIEWGAPSGVRIELAEVGGMTRVADSGRPASPLPDEKQTGVSSDTCAPSGASRRSEGGAA